MGGPPPQGSLGSAVQTAELDFNLSAESIPVVTADGDSLEEHSTDLFFDTDASPKELNVSAAVAATDGSGHVGAADARFASLVGNQHQVFASSGDANPVVQVDSGGVKFGPGGGSGLDFAIQRIDSDTLVVRDPSGSPAKELRAQVFEPIAQIRADQGNTVSIRARDSDDESSVTVATLNRASTPTFDLDQARLTANLALSADASHDIGSTSNGLANVFLGDDSPVQFGASQDWRMDYDATNTKVRLHDGTNDVFAIQDGSTNIDVLGAEIERPYAQGGAHNVETLSGNKTLSVTDPQFQKLDPDGSARTVTLPAEADADGKSYELINTGGGTSDITVEDDGSTTIATLSPGEKSTFVCDGSSWVGMGKVSVTLL